MEKEGDRESLETNDPFLTLPNYFQMLNAIRKILHFRKKGRCQESKRSQLIYVFSNPFSLNSKGRISWIANECRFRELISEKI